MGNKGNGKQNEFKPSIGRLGTIMFVILILFSIIAIKLFKIQFIDASSFQKRATVQYSKGKEPILPLRGEVFDRNGIPLAANTIKCSIACEPYKIKNKIEVARIISYLFNLKEEKVKRDLAGLNGGTQQYSPIAKNVNPSDAEKLKRFNIDGIIFEYNYKRTYPQTFVGSTLIGFTGTENNGLAGIEESLNTILTGSNGEKVFPTDIEGGIVGTSYIVTKPVKHGKSIYLTIDMTIQYIVEEELMAACEEWNADGGSCVVMDTATGEILAMAQEPRYDPNSGLDSKLEIRDNRALTYTYEPGSVIKGIITAAALNEKVIDDNSEFLCEGSRRIGGFTLRCPTGAHGHQKLRDILRNSCNMGFIQVGEKLNQRLYKYYLDFGFGTKPDTGLWEEQGVVLETKKWSKSTLATMSFGQGISVTPIQLATAYCAIANGGVLMKPILIRLSYDPNTDTAEKNSPMAIRQVVNKDVASHTLELLHSIITRDGINEAMIAGYNVAGKTGTAPKTLPKGGYDWTKFDCSFCGIVPAETDAENKLVILVTLDNPHKPGISPFGRSVAAPCFKRVAEKVLASLRIAPKEKK